MNTHGERNVVVSGEDDELGSGVSNANITEDKRVIKGNSAGNCSGSISMSLSCKRVHTRTLHGHKRHHHILHSWIHVQFVTPSLPRQATPLVWSCLPLLSI